METTTALTGTYSIYRFISRNLETGTESTHTVTGANFAEVVRRYYAYNLPPKGETLILWYEV